jgi:YhcG PDDEXK nuclease domain
LKIGELQPEHIGKMQFYLAVLDDTVRLESENPSIGILICKSKDRTIASVITSKAAINDHFKTGQRNRGQDMKLFYRAGGSLGKLFVIFRLASLPTSGRA